MPRNKRPGENTVLNVAFHARSHTHVHSLLCLNFIGLIKSAEEKLWINHWTWRCLEACNKSTNAITTDREKWAQALKYLDLLSTQSHFTWSIQGTNHSPRQEGRWVIWWQVNGGKKKQTAMGQRAGKGEWYKICAARSPAKIHPLAHKSGKGPKLH